MSEQEPIKIVIPVEEDPPLKPERPSTDAKQAANEAGRKLADSAKAAAQKAWDSEARRAATQKLGTVADKGARYVGTRVADAVEQQTRRQATAVQERIKTTDWQQEAKSGLAQGLRWMSQQLGEVAARVNTKPKKSPPDQDPAGS